MFPFTDLFQGINFMPFKLNTYKLYRDLHFLYNDPIFNNASILHPINAPEDFYILHSYFSRVSLQSVTFPIPVVTFSELQFYRFSCI